MPSPAKGLSAVCLTAAAAAKSRLWAWSLFFNLPEALPLWCLR
jgi:hypothetical protein